MEEEHKNPLRRAQFTPDLTIEVLRGDITTVDVDVIVNAANKYLKHGGGVAGAISQRGGPAIQAESDRWIKRHGTIDSLNPAFTSGGLMPCKYVIHTVGPIWGEGDEDRKLLQSITSALLLSEKLKAKSIAFPAISTGIFGFPLERAADIFMKAFKQTPDSLSPRYIKQIYLVLFDDKTLKAFIDAFDKYNWEN